MMQFERWSLLILGEALLRETTHCADFERNLLIDPGTLDARLTSLVNSGLMDRTFEADGESEAAFVLTDKGRDLEQVIRALDAWSERWSLPVPATAELSMQSDSATSPPPIDVD